MSDLTPEQQRKRKIHFQNARRRNKAGKKTNSKDSKLFEGLFKGAKDFA